jgi:dTDP-glucose pyrophosphorylase
MNPTLVVLAAGMGSRYGGLKQLDPVGPGGETILDYSVFDAVRCGFGRVVFVIRRDFEGEFRERVGRRFEGRLDVDYAFQSLNDLPDGWLVPEGREKPWGTGHAVLAARDVVDEPFLAINADDFYGHPAIAAVGHFLKKAPPEHPRFCLAGYRLETTLSEHGSVSRGVCSVATDGRLQGIREHTRIQRAGSVIKDESSETLFSGSERVSMNCWGFTPDIFEMLTVGFRAFLETSAESPKSEYYIPSAVEAFMHAGQADVELLPVESPWFGVTYREDRPSVVESLRKFVEQGIYPAALR